MMGRIHSHDFNSGETHVVTKGMFNDGSPTFARVGDWLYFTSDRRFAPSYSSLDGTWIYDDSGVLVAVPLRDDVSSPWLEESDEEAWVEDEEKDMKTFVPSSVGQVRGLGMVAELHLRPCNEQR